MEELSKKLNIPVVNDSNFIEIKCSFGRSFTISFNEVIFLL